MDIQAIIAQAVKEAVTAQMQAGVVPAAETETQDEVEIEEAPVEQLESNAKSGI